MYNNYRFNKKFKEETDVAVLKSDLVKRQELNEYIQNFTLQKLIKGKAKFAEYIRKYGDRLPIQTSYPIFNYYLNKACFYSYVFRTNQPYAYRVNQIIEDAENKSHENNEPIVDIVFNALNEIKKTYDDMTTKKIYTGEVRTNIENLFRKFDLNLTDENINKRMEEIETTLKTYPKQNTKERIISSYD